MSALVSIAAPASFFEENSASDALGADDRLAMLALTSRFEWAFDARRLDVLEALLTEDVEIDHLFGHTTNRRDSMAMLREKVPFQGLRHQATNPVVFVDDLGRPSVLSYLMVVQVGDENGRIDHQLPRILAHAVVTDRFRKVDGRWRIAGRTFEQFRTQRDYLPDDVAWEAVTQTASARTAGTGQNTGRKSA